MRRISVLPWLLIATHLGTLGNGDDVPMDTEVQLRRRLRKTADSKDHPGVVELDPGLDAPSNVTYHLLRCRNHASAYSAAWLSPAEFVLRPDYYDRDTLEWHSHMLYMQMLGGSYKLEEQFA